MVDAESGPDPASTAGIRPVTFCRCSAAFTCWFLLCAWVFIAPSGFLDKVAVSLKCCQCVFPECSSAAASAGKEWEEYLQIRGLVERIRKKQKGKYMYSIMLTHDWDLHTHPIGLNNNNVCLFCVCVQACPLCLRAAGRSTSLTWCLGLRKTGPPVSASLWPTLGRKAMAWGPPETSRFLLWFF